MLYPDAEKRIFEINEMANLFKQKGFLQTSKEILNISDILKGDAIPQDFLKQLDALFDIFEKEFVDALSIGQNYRKICFNEIKEIIFKAIGKNMPNVKQAMLVIYPFVKKIKHGGQICGYIADELIRKTIKDKTVVFHLYCYAYLLNVEGIFDELARILYFFKIVEPTKIPSADFLRKLSVWNVLGEIKPRPIFLKDWEEKKSIRNAIGHAEVYYDPVKNEAIFIDEPANFKKTLTFEEFAQKALELEDTVSTFTYIIILLRLYDLIMVKNPYE